MTSPLVPAHVDLRDFSYMPLDVVRLRDSKLVSHTTGEGFRCAVLLWCVAWHQIPAGSLPDDDLQLAQYAGFGRVVKEWKKLKTEALHGWLLCDDGRWYHPTVAEKALEAWTERLKQQYRTECARIKKAAQRAHTDATYPTFEEWLVSRDKSDVSLGTTQDSPKDVTGETPSKGREGKGREGICNGNDSPPPRAAAPQVGVFEGHDQPAPSAANPAAPYAIALRKEGVQVTSMNPDLIEAVREGVSLEHLLEVARLNPGKPIKYLTTQARREHAERATTITAGDSREARRESVAERTRRLAVEGDARDREAAFAESGSADLVGTHG